MIKLSEVNARVGWSSKTSRISRESEVLDKLYRFFSLEKIDKLRSIVPVVEVK